MNDQPFPFFILIYRLGLNSSLAMVLYLSCKTTKSQREPIFTYQRSLRGRKCDENRDIDTPQPFFFLDTRCRVGNVKQTQEVNTLVQEFRPTNDLQTYPCLSSGTDDSEFRTDEDRDKRSSELEGNRRHPRNLGDSRTVLRVSRDCILQVVDVVGRVTVVGYRQDRPFERSVRR